MAEANAGHYARALVLLDRAAAALPKKSQRQAQRMIARLVTVVLGP